jgi:hypothetical protein
MNTVRPATTRGPVTGSNLRVVYDESKVVVVSASQTTYLERVGDVVEARGGKVTIPTTSGDLTVVRQAGCTCGKPWLTKPSGVSLLTSAPA